MPKLVLILLDRPQRLTREQLDKLSDILINIGTLFFGAIVVPVFVPAVDKPGIGMLIIGLGFSLAPWVLSVLLMRRVRL